MSTHIEMIGEAADLYQIAIVNKKWAIYFTTDPYSFLVSVIKIEEVKGHSPYDHNCYTDRSDASNLRNYKTTSKGIPQYSTGNFHEKGKSRTSKDCYLGTADYIANKHVVDLKRWHMRPRKIIASFSRRNHD